MTLSRRDLELGRMREIYQEASDAHRALDDEALSTSLAATLAAKPKGAGWWVFGYGSLLWNPLFPVAEARSATVHGLHRRFCLRSLASRGTRERPGLVLALEPGGSCRGVAFRLPAPLAIDELHLLWRREMVVGSYRPRWVRARIGDRTLTALAFTVRRDHPQYAALTMDEQADTIANACGAFGSSCEYLMRTRAALAEHGVVDRYLERLAEAVVARQRA
ncbi:glutathione-specific gamma-glutamylcyclotransferase [Burkholderiales bacterium]|nr:glutathione-specific gamma-glutamylcyclotransferase [Burkholderiales bacterium]